MAEIEKDINLLEETPVGSEDINLEEEIDVVDRRRRRFRRRQLKICR